MSDKYTSIKQQVVVLVMTLLLPWVTQAHEDVPPLPAEVSAFVPTDHDVINYTVGDLNGDGRNDAILVLKKRSPLKQLPDGVPLGQRPLLVLQRQIDGKLKLAARCEEAIKCEECGGVFGDPFEGIETSRKGFTILHYGGSAWRWREDFRFAFSRRDQTWQLVAVDTLNYYTGDPEKMEEQHYRPSRDFGLINLADFNVDNWEGKGK